MASTTNYSWTTPDDTALVKDGAAAIRSLGSSIDTTTKALNPSTTLGDIEYRSATANTNTRLGIGTSGQVLSVAGGVPTWATPSAGAAAAYLSKPTAGSLYYARSGNSAVTSSTNTASLSTVDLTYYVPILVSNVTATRIAIRTASNWTGVGITMRLGIYANDSTLNIPTTVLLDAGQVTPIAASTDYEITISQALSPGLYWLAAKTNAYTSGTNSYNGSPGTAGGWSALGGGLAYTLGQALTGIKLNGYSETQAAGVLATAGTLAPENTAINIAIGY